jgi:hypothetical protein
MEFLCPWLTWEMLRDYVENYSFYFVNNLKEKQYLIYKYSSRLFQHFLSSLLSIQHWHAFLNHPYTFAVMMSLYSTVVLLLLYHHTQVNSSLLQSAQWPISVDSISTEQKPHDFNQRAVSKQNSTTAGIPQQTPILNLGRSASKTIPSQSHNTTIPPKKTVMKSIGTTTALLTELDGAFAKENNDREAAKITRLKQFPPSTENPLAKKPSRIKSFLKAASRGLGLKRSHSLSSVTTDSSLPSQATRSELSSQSPGVGPNISNIRTGNNIESSSAAADGNRNGYESPSKFRSNAKAFQTPPRHPTARPSLEMPRNSHNLVQSPFSTVSTLTPDSQFVTMVNRQRSSHDGYRSILPGTGRDMSAEEKDNNDNESRYSDTNTGIIPSESDGTMMSSSGNGYLDDANAPPDVVLERSIRHPSVLVGWRIMIPGYGTGLIVSMQKKRFSTTRFVVQLENDQVVVLKLQRSKEKGNVPFQLIRKVR